MGENLTKQPMRNFSATLQLKNRQSMQLKGLNF